MILYNADCMKYLDSIKHVRCIFADPPDNLGLKYDFYNDKLPEPFYLKWLEELVRTCVRKSDYFWLSHSSIHNLEVARIVKDALYQGGIKYKARMFLWTYSFGYYLQHDMHNLYRPIWCIRHPDAKHYVDPIRVPSVRMEIHDDRSKGPKIPGDVWDFPRVAPGHAERRDWHPTQHNYLVLKRIMQYTCQPEDTFLDLFAGSGTCFEAGIAANHDNVVGVELSPGYCKNIIREFNRVTLASCL